MVAQSAKEAYESFCTFTVVYTVCVIKTLPWNNPLLRAGEQCQKTTYGNLIIIFSII